MDLSGAHAIVPVYNPMSIVNMALLSIILAAAHISSTLALHQN